MQLKIIILSLISSITLVSAVSKKGTNKVSGHHHKNATIKANATSAGTKSQAGDAIRGVNIAGAVAAIAAGAILL
ncbi:hypothetical protein KGF54_004771 [Candida jiufengensis]|uniref:uncharacterized protein n=1 Tax=Candida jiufengensis TaxID=497108 RepID=UPI002225961E|nr:uncharacterized protein KGF54_004771 [Candida jiufengensis]KAI5951696.1 hypothetical protein KGF54_004771 [Candida jiufengensis]